MINDPASISEYCIALGLAIAGLYWLSDKRRRRGGKNG